MSRLAKHMIDYQHTYRKPLARYIHFVSVPLLFFAIFLAFSWVFISVPNVVGFNMAWLLVAAVLTYYLTLDWQLAGIMAILLVLLALLAGFFSEPGPTLRGLYIFLVTFGIGAVLQLIGHAVEGRIPNWKQNFIHILTIPIILIAKVCFLFGYKKEVSAELDRNPGQ